MGDFKTEQEIFNCAVVNKKVFVTTIFQDVGGIGSNDQHFLPIKKECQTMRQCEIASLIQKCPLKEIPL